MCCENRGIRRPDAVPYHTAGAVVDDDAGLRAEENIGGVPEVGADGTGGSGGEFGGDGGMKLLGGVRRGLGWRGNEGRTTWRPFS